MMPQLRCMVLHDEQHDTHGHAVQLHIDVDPARLLFTLNACRLAMPPDTDQIHLQNWQHLEALLQQLITLYGQRYVPPARRRMRRRWRHGQAPD